MLFSIPGRLTKHGVCKNTRKFLKWIRPSSFSNIAPNQDSSKSRVHSADVKVAVTGSAADVHPPFGNYSHGISVEVDDVKQLFVTSGQLATTIDGTIPDGCAAQVCGCSFWFVKQPAWLLARTNTRCLCDVLVVGLRYAERIDIHKPWCTAG